MKNRLARGHLDVEPTASDSSNCGHGRSNANHSGGSSIFRLL